MGTLLDFLKGKTDIFEDVVNKANDAILIVDLNTGEILWHNPQLNRLLDYPGDIEVKTIFDVLCDEDLEESAVWLAKVYEEGGGISNDFCLVQKDGKKIPVEISAKVVPFQKKNAGVLYIRDTRERLALIRQIQEKNQMLLEGMNYARRLQMAAMPPPERLQDLFPKSFILYRPKEILSGDFYLFRKFKEVTFVVVGDCTGHGIPGSLLAMLGVNIFNDVLIELYEEALEKILAEVNERMTVSLSYEGNVIRDGMDCSILRWDGEKIQFAGCNHRLYVVTDSELHTYKGDRISIGYNEYKQNYSFSSYTISVKPGDKLYMSTDGFPDQFGGAKGKKLTRGKFKRLLLEASNYPIEQQKEFVENFLNKWMNGFEQTDDILVIGIEIS